MFANYICFLYVLRLEWLVLWWFIFFPLEMERSKSTKSQSSLDIPQSVDSITSTPPSSSSKRHRFFSSFRKKFRSEKYKDKNSNIEQLSASQPNIYRSSCRSPPPLSPDDGGMLTDVPIRKLYREPSVSSGRCRTNSDGVTIDRMSSEEKDVDSGIAVIETTTMSQVGHTLYLFSMSVNI